MQITDKLIGIAESILIGNHHFDEERINFIKRLDSCDLLAVPGSGKTTALQAKLYCMIKSQKDLKHQGILVLSHTNVAVEEIKKNLKARCPELFDYPNFVGTVQDFVDTFLAIPYYNKKYGHNISRIDAGIYNKAFLKLFDKSLRCSDRVWLFYGHQEKEQAIKFNIKISSEGNLVPWNYGNQKPFKAIPKPPKTWAGHEEENRKKIYKKLLDIKKRLFAKGILNYDDCYVLAQMYVKDAPRIINVLNKRFPFVFIDETQDLQSHQIEIINHIFNNKDVCMQRVGDVNQSIFHTGVKNADCLWIPQNVITLNNSMRLTPEIANVVNAFMVNRANGQLVNGTRRLENPIKPYLMVYDYNHRGNIKNNFVELITHYHLNNTIEGKKYGYHIIGWNSKWNDAEQHIPDNLRLCDILSEFKELRKGDSSFKDSLADYVSASLKMDNTGQISNIIYIVICECLRMCGIDETRIYNGNEVKSPYTISSLKKDIKTKNTTFVSRFRIEFLKVLRLICMHKTNDTINGMMTLINYVLAEYGASHNDYLNNFLSALVEQNESLDTDNDINIKYETVHSAKGQTHCATLYIETMYEGHYESDHVLDKPYRKLTKKKPAKFYSNPFYKESDKVIKSIYAQSAMKMVYVGLSRPTHLLCYAMHISSFEKYDAERLRLCGWEIIDLTTA